ncbi:MAG: lipocalin-like domain-containing protein [Alphaproteobacteria bacterium]
MQSLVGFWRLIEGYALDPSGERLPSPLGPRPAGVAEFSSERLVAVAVDARVALPPTVDSRVLIAYSGTYRFDGDEFITSVDAASDPALIGTEQRRRVKLDGMRMIVSPVNEVLASHPGSLEFIWERVDTATNENVS